MPIEEAKLVFVFEARDAAETLLAYGGLLEKGLLKKRKLARIVDCDDAAMFVNG